MTTERTLIDHSKVHLPLKNSALQKRFSQMSMLKKNLRRCFTNLEVAKLYYHTKMEAILLKEFLIKLMKKIKKEH